MASSKITLIGMYNYMSATGSDLFLHMALPTGIDKDAVIENILIRGGEFEVLHSDPNFVRNSMVTWSKKWHWTFNKWFNAINIEYNPLENYDRIEEGTDKETSSGTNVSRLNNQRSDNLTQRTTGSSSNNNTTTERLISAFDSSTYSPHDKDITTTGTDLSTTNTGNVTNSGTVNDTTSVNKDNNHNWRIHGNIGVTTSQQMLQSELDIALFNLYDKITDVFLQEYIIPIY